MIGRLDPGAVAGAAPMAKVLRLAAAVDPRKWRRWIILRICLGSLCPVLWLLVHGDNEDTAAGIRKKLGRNHRDTGEPARVSTWTISWAKRPVSLGLNQ
jgi:hypothetical protein